MDTTKVLKDCRDNLSPTQFADGIRMMRLIREFGGFVALRHDFYHSDILAVMDAGLFKIADTMEYEISPEGMAILKTFDPLPRP